MREGYAVGIDMGGTGVRLGLFDASGTVLSQIAIETKGGGAGFPERLAKASRELIGRVECPAGMISALGVAVAGMIDTSTRESCIPNADFNLKMIEEALHVVFPHALFEFINDADAALVGEMRYGAGCKYDDILLLTLGTGVGCAIASNGKLVLGAHGLAGEIGHMQIVTEGGRLCGCGGTGCLERYVSGPGVAFTASEYRDAYKGASLLDGIAPLSCEEVFDAARRGDRLASGVIDEFSKMLAFSLRQAALLTDPDVFIIGGGMSEGNDVFLDKLTASYRLQAHPLYASIPIVIAQLGNEAGFRGAADYAMQRLDD